MPIHTVHQWQNPGLPNSLIPVLFRQPRTVRYWEWCLDRLTIQGSTFQTVTSLSVDSIYPVGTKSLQGECLRLETDAGDDGAVHVEGLWGSALGIHM